jgi:phage terminase small subunit
MLELTGAFQHNPSRMDCRINEPVVDEGVGKPPTHLSKDEKKIWKELSKDVPWLAVSDRLALEMVCRLTTRMRTNPVDFTGSETSALTVLVRTLGMTPSDRSRVSAPQKQKEDEWTKLLAGPTQLQINELEQRKAMQIMEQ